MSFSRVNSLGWALNEELTSAQMNALDLDHSRAVDGNAGGVYTPSSAIDFQGSGIKATTLVMNGTAWPTFATRTITLGQGLNDVFVTDKGNPGSGATYHYDGRINNAECDWAAPVSFSGCRYQFYVDTAGSPNIPQIWFELIRYPTGATLKSAAIDIHHPTAGADPATMPKAGVWLLDHPVGGSPSLSQIGADVAVAASYRNAVRRISVSFTPFAPTVGEQRRLFLALKGEGGSGAVAGLRALQTYLTFDVAELRV